MHKRSKVAVTSRSFSKDPELRNSLKSKYVEVKFNDEGLQLDGENLVNFLLGYDKAITSLEKIDDSVLAKLPDLRVISKYGVGIDMLDLEALRNHEVRLGWQGGVNKRSVSELVLGLTISMLRNVVNVNNEVKLGLWNQHKGNLLTGKTFGIVGFGNIGKDLVDLIRPFNCKILIYDILKPSLTSLDANVSVVSIEELLTHSDIVSLHLPLTIDSQNMIDKERMSLMKKSSILINLSRGGIVDEQALKELLKDNRIAGAAFDVFSNEPPQDSDLLNLPNFLATSHIGGIAKESIKAMGIAAIDGLENNVIP